MSAEGGPTTWIKTEGDPRNTYLARIGWIDSNTVSIQQLNRLQNRNDFLTADIKTGAVKRVFRDESKQWVDIVEEVPWIDGGRTFLWLSERDGWQHVYRVPREGGDGQLITKFDADVTDIAGFDEKGGLDVFPRLARQRRPALPVSLASRRQRRAGARHAGGLSRARIATTSRRTASWRSTPTRNSRRRR